MANANWPLVACQWDPAYGFNDGLRRWYSLTSRLVGPLGQSNLSGTYGRQYELSAIETGTAVAVLDNRDEALNPANLASPYAVMSGWVLRQVTNTFTATGGSAPFYNTLQFTSATLAGSLVVVVAVTSGGTSSVVPLANAKTFTAMGSVTSAPYVLNMWGTVCAGGDTSVVVTSNGTFTCVALEYVGCGDMANLDVTASATASGSVTSVSTGSTAVATAGDLRIVCGAPTGTAATPTSPVWGTSTQRVASAITTAGGNNCMVFVGDQFPTTASTQGDTVSWTNASASALGLVVTIKQSPTVQLLTPPSGSKAVIPYRPFRWWAMWPSATSGNLLNATNDQWAVLGSVNGTYADTAGFEGGTTGTWWVDHAQAIANSVTRAHDGTHSMVVTWPTATTGTAYISTDIPPVETGYTYTISAWVYVPTGIAGAALQWGLVNGTGSATTNAWTRISVTKTRTDGQDDRLYLVTTGNTTAGDQIWVDSVQVEIAASPSAFQTTGSTVSPMHSGFIERYPETWEAQGYWSWEKLASVDGLAFLSAIKLQDCMTEDIEQDLPSLYLPLSDAPASGVPAPMAAPAVWTAARYGMNSDLALGVAGAPGLDSSACASFLTSSGELIYFFGPTIGGTATSTITDAGSGLSYEFWYNTSAASITPMVNIYGVSNWSLVVTVSSGQLVFQSNNGAVVNYTITDAVPTNDGMWHYAVLTELSSGGTVTASLTVDNRAAGTGSYVNSTAMAVTRVTLAGSQPIKYSRFSIYPTALSGTRIASHYLSSKGFPYDTTGQRISRVLAWMPWPGATSIATGVTLASLASGQSGKTVQDALNGLVAAEQGVLFVAPTGALTFFSRDHYYLAATSTVTLGDGGTPYLGDVSAGTDITYVYNQIQVTGASGTAWSVSDARSVLWYGPRTLQTTVSAENDADAQQIARHQLSGYKDPHMRVITLSMNPTTDATIWATALSLKFGDRVTFVRATPSGATVRFDAFVDRIQHEEGPGVWTVKLQISPAAPLQAWILGDATYGVLGTANLVY